MCIEHLAPCLPQSGRPGNESDCPYYFMRGHGLPQSCLSHWGWPPCLSWFGAWLGVGASLIIQARPGFPSPLPQNPVFVLPLPSPSMLMVTACPPLGIPGRQGSAQAPCFRIQPGGSEPWGWTDEERLGPSRGLWSLLSQATQAPGLPGSRGLLRVSPTPRPLTLGFGACSLGPWRLSLTPVSTPILPTSIPEVL